MTLKIDCQLRDLDFTEVGTHAQKMEEMGFDAAWTFEAGQDAFTPLTLAAAATKNIHLGTNIAVAFGRSPFAMAQQAWDIQKLSRGRMHLGLGTQVRAHIERRFSMPFDHPARRISDYVRCMKAIFDNFQNGTKPDYKGEFYQFTLNNPLFSPGAIDHPDIPVYLAGVNPRMCRAAGEVADGFHAHPIHNMSYLKEVVLPAIDEGAKTRGKSVKDLHVQTMVLIAAGETQAEIDKAVEDVRMQISFYGSTPNYRGVLEHMGYGDLGKELSQMMRSGQMAEMPKKIPDAIVEQVAVIGKLSEVGPKVRERYEGVLDRVAYYYPIPKDAEIGNWKAFTDAVKHTA
ncbi:MAG: TIGR03617 family F420-dependent LLM class oxidoreductase [Minwuia sp.]|uniref:TIGR03617 family F420-dependent LLM class oxidoreductase n=1 Tax=Minwuia sp. TaxID=2493630 RepID=UPI003A873009